MAEAKMKTTYMAFLSDAPLCGIDPHPAYAPETEIASFDAEGFAMALMAEDDLNLLREQAIEDLEMRLEAVDEGNLEDADDADIIHKVVIHDDGRVDVYEIEGETPFAHLTMTEIYEAFGMEMPKEGA